MSPYSPSPLYLLTYIERMGTGTRDMIRLRRTGLPDPKFSQRNGTASATVLSAMDALRQYRRY